MIDITLLHSPLVGPATLRPLEPAFRTLGFSAVTPDLRNAAFADAPWDHVVSAVRDVAGEGETALLAHSNAGLFVPVVVEALWPRVRCCIFVDALIPRPDATPVTSPQMLQMLEGMADDDGLLPPWTDWWPPEEVDRLFPDPGTKHRIAGEVQRVPLDYFRRSVPAPAKWTQLPCAYVSFGATYAAEAQHADELGWPTRLLDGLHLHSVVAPDDVARTVAGLIGVAP